MQENQDNLAPQQVSENEKKVSPKLNKQRTVYIVIAVFLALNIFGSGWLLGSGKIKIRANSITSIPEVTKVEKAPNNGVDDIYTLLNQNFDGNFTDEAILDGMKAGLVKAAGDPFTEYLSKQETKDFNDSLNGQFEGIGAELGKEGSFVIIVAPLKGTPADRAGIRPQDIIISIDGESAADISISEAVKRIRGPKGEEVKLTVIREGKQVEVSIIRDTINVPSVEWKQDGNLGIITISRFGDDTSSLTNQAATELKNKGVKGIVLDLRGNPGGLLDAAINVSSVWLPRGSTVLEEKRDGKIIQTFPTKSNPVFDMIPTVILIDKGSASASEIVSGALHDNKAATLMGVQSFGKGSVQRVVPLDGGGSLKVTIAHWFTPNDISIDKEGITPDTEIKMTQEDRVANRDPQLDAAKKFLSQ